MPWTFMRLPDGDLEVRDANRVRSIIQKRPGPSGWVVHRIDSNGRMHGCDSFRSLAEAKRWATNEKIFAPY